MLLDALLAYAHFIAIFAAIVFSTSEAALCRPEWLNAAVVDRLVLVNRVYRIAWGLVLLTGLARMGWGAKWGDLGWAFYGAQPWLHVKLALWALMAAMAWPPMRAYRRWQAAAHAGLGLPAEDDIRATRRTVMRATHLMLLLPLAAVLLARGMGWR